MLRRCAFGTNHPEWKEMEGGDDMIREMGGGIGVLT